jgi:ABC-type bacteriocin/lantibiotic exporter with double-glycine peptidase domain
MKFALYFFGGLLIMRGDITIGKLLVFGMYYNLLSGSIHTVSSTDAELQSNMPFYDRVIQELKTVTKTTEKQIVPEIANSDVCIRNINFSYDKSQAPILDNFSLNIKQGERVAIVGQSGAGKTTVLKLITGMLSPNSGQILFSGVDINKINHNFLYRKIGFVLQENLLFNTTIRENLRLACPNADIKMLDDACKKACILDFIYTQPKKYDTVIGEKGIKLSGGQRQRLVLARLFLRNVDILIFDEATSSIDQYSESIIHDAINAIGREKTIIVVAHRESSIALCDRVINLN